MLSATPLAEGPFVVVDIEATGARPGTHEVIEIGAVRIERGRIVGRFESLVRPSVPTVVPPVISALTGITEAMLASAPSLDEVLPRFREFAEDAVLVAHNHRFDLGFLDWEAERRWGLPFPRPVLDTLALARRLDPSADRNNLRELAERWGTSVRPAHRAGDDAHAAGEVFLAMVPQLQARGLEVAGDVAGFCGMDRQGELAAKLALTTSLPAAPGLYLMRDGAGTVVHVGRAKDLRARVRSYFYGSSGPGRPPVASLTEEIQWIECVSELDALLLESRLVTRYRPTHNARRVRGDRGPWLLSATGGPFPALKVSGRPLAPGAAGPFASEGALEAVAAQLRREYALRRCTRRLTRRTGRTPCPHRDDGTCPRPCVERLDEAQYSERLRGALGAFSHGERDFRETLRARLGAAATAMRYEEAIRYRDALKAFERSLAALRTVEVATRDPGFAIVEGTGERFAVNLIRRGYLVKTVRAAAEELGEPGFVSRLRRLLATHFPEQESVEDPRLLSARRLSDVFLIASYRAQHSPWEVSLGGGADVALERLLAALRGGRPEDEVA